jgi:hypothetical protein
LAETVRENRANDNKAMDVFWIVFICIFERSLVLK